MLEPFSKNGKLVGIYLGTGSNRVLCSCDDSDAQKAFATIKPGQKLRLAGQIAVDSIEPKTPRLDNCQLLPSEAD